MTKAQMNQLLVKLSDQNISKEVRSQQLVDILIGYKEGGEDNYAQAAEEVFRRLAISTVDESAMKKSQMLDEILRMAMSAPMRPATFIESTKMKGLTMAQSAMVVLDNGEVAYLAVPEPKVIKELKLGDRIVVDGKASILLNEPAGEELQYGHEVRYERRINGRHVEILTQHDERQVVLVCPELLKQIESEEVKPGRNLIIQKNGLVCVKAVPEEKDGFAHYRFLDRGPVPDVLVDRDIGSPPRVIADVAQHVREEMTRPELRRKFRLRPCITRLLCGVSGTGKTLAVQAIHRQMYDIMSEVTDTPVAKLPPRVFRFRSSQALSMWFGESDKNIDRFFDEVEALADVLFINQRGKEFHLPVLVVMEEADGMGRARGQEAVYDRVMTTTLQRLDPSRSSLANRMVVFLSTTNEPGIVDPAFLRRIGGSVEVFGRLDQKGFTEVLRKHLDGLPADGGWKSVLSEVNHWLFSDEDQGVVEMKLHGYNQSLVKYRRDFMTGALIERAVHEAATQAWEEAMHKMEAGISAQQICKALDRQIQSVVHQLSEQNVNRYTDMPEGAHVAALRRIKPTVKV